MVEMQYRRYLFNIWDCYSPTITELKVFNNPFNSKIIREEVTDFSYFLYEEHHFDAIVIPCKMVEYDPYLQDKSYHLLSERLDHGSMDRLLDETDANLKVRIR